MPSRTETYNVSDAAQVTVTTHPASSVSLAPQDMLAGDRGEQLSLTALASADHEWRVLRFNSVTRQSVCRVVLPASGGPALPVPVCIATEYLKSMLASGNSRQTWPSRPTPLPVRGTQV